jgi:hypothetical protein
LRVSQKLRDNERHYYENRHRASERHQISDLIATAQPGEQAPICPMTKRASDS